MDELLDLATPEATAHLHANEVLIDAMLSAEYWRQLNPHLSVAGTSATAGDASRPIAVRAASVRYLEGELLATAEPALGLLEYRVRCALRAPQPAQLAGRSARHADARWTAVPRGERELADFAELAREWTRDATDDAGRVHGRATRDDCVADVRRHHGFRTAKAAAEALGAHVARARH